MFAIKHYPWRQRCGLPTAGCKNWQTDHGIKRGFKSGRTWWRCLRKSIIQASNHYDLRYIL